MSTLLRGLLLVLLACLLSACAPDLTIYYSASLNGNLLGCDCWGYPEAGLDKRVLYLRENPPTPGDLILDAGNILETGREPFLADLILRTYNESGYQAVAVGTHELTEGPEILANRTVAEFSPQFLSHNLMLDGKALSEAPLLIESGETITAVVSLAEPSWFEPFLGFWEGRLTVRDPATVFTEQRQLAADAGASVIVLLAHGSETWIRDLASGDLFTPALGVRLGAVILAGEEKVLEEKLRYGVPLVSPGEEGNRLGLLRIHLGRWITFKNELREFHYLGPGDITVFERGILYATHLDEKRTSHE